MKTRLFVVAFLTLLVGTVFAGKQTIFLTETQLPYESQACFSRSDLNDLKEEIQKNWDVHRKITSVAYTNYGWYVVMSDNSGLNAQTYKVSSSWPKEWVSEKWDLDYYITSIAYSGSQWMIVMSKTSKYSAQSYNCNTINNLSSWIKEKWDASFYITDAVYDGSHWMVVMSKGDEIDHQALYTVSSNVEQQIREKTWNQGWCIQFMNYGGGVYLLVACTYKKDNDRQQSYSIMPENTSRFIQDRYDNDHFVVRIGGGFDGPSDYSIDPRPITASRTVVAPREKKLASLTWLAYEPTTRQKNYAFRIGVKSESKIEDVNVYVNGELDRGIVPVTNDGYDMTINRTVNLAVGTNNIKVVVRNTDGDAVTERNVVYEPQKNPSPVAQQRRIALVMGNSRYNDYDKRLNNPVNDATDLARKLEDLGFDVIKSTDQTQQGMETAINNFAERVKNYEVALFYYAGHGMRCNGCNYLIPIDASLPNESAVKYKCINANMVLDVMDRAHCQMKIIILDACRNNPFTRAWNRGLENDGLGIMNAPKGTFIAFSTAPGDVAQDGTGRNSPYTTALLQTLDEPNLSITDFFQEVLEKVATSTNERQTPWTSNSFRGKFYFNQQ